MPGDHLEDAMGGREGHTEIFKTEEQTAEWNTDTPEKVGALNENGVFYQNFVSCMSCLSFVLFRDEISMMS